MRTTQYTFPEELIMWTSFAVDSLSSPLFLSYKQEFKHGPYLKNNDNIHTNASI